MFRKFILAVSTIATLSSPILASNANAMGGFHGGGMGMHGGHGGGGHGGGGGHNWHQGWNHHHWYPRFYASRYYVRPVTYAVSRPVVNTCNCLVKEYSPDGVVIFKDLCTKESASAVLPGSPAAQAEINQQTASAETSQPATNNFAGRTFQDYQNSNQPK